MKLNPQQQAAVEHGAGPAMVLAGAGSGKTRVLTARASRLLKSGLQPEEIILLTFTNKAAGEMKRRVQEMSGWELTQAGTFHRLGVLLLRRYGRLVGIEPDFQILDSNDQEVLMKKVLADLKVEARMARPAAVLAAVSNAKQSLTNPSEYEQQAEGRFAELVASAYQLYEKALKKNNAVDFDNLLIYSVKLLEDATQVRQEWQSRVKHVLIDEYQDTNLAQYRLTQLLTGAHQNLFVVGDAAQAIYSWRGADYRNLERLREDYPTIKEYRLEENYRSTASILEGASGVIARNRRHPVLELWTQQQADEPIRIIEHQDGEVEADRIASWAAAATSSQQSVAILYRTNAQSRAFEEALVRRSVPYRLYGGVRFYARAEIKDALAYLMWYLNPENEVAVTRLMKIGKRRFAQVEAWRQKQPAGLERTTVQLLDDLMIISGYRDRLNRDDPDDQNRLENLEELRVVASQHPVPTSFLEQVALVEHDQLDLLSEAGNVAPVSLMSLHAAKGLEFDMVAMVGMEEGLLPHSRSLEDGEALEEERRLCYVGMTRARQLLVMSFARRRRLVGGYRPQTPSRFLSEIPARAVNLQGAPSLRAAQELRHLLP